MYKVDTLVHSEATLTHAKCTSVYTRDVWLGDSESRHQKEVGLNVQNLLTFLDVNREHD